jgi:hypothetical protein
MPSDDPPPACVALKKVEFFYVPSHADKNALHEKRQALFNIVFD